MYIIQCTLGHYLVVILVIADQEALLGNGSTRYACHYTVYYSEFAARLRRIVDIDYVTICIYRILDRVT